MKQHQTVWGVLATLAGGIAWGFSGCCVQFLFAHTQMDALLLTTCRELVAGLVFLATLLLWQRETLVSMLHDANTLKRLAIFGSCGLFLNSALYATTIAYTNAGTATVLQSLNIVMVLGLSCLVRQRLPRHLELAALACATLAVLLIATHGDIGVLNMPLLGLLFGLATAGASVFYTTYPKPLFERWGSYAATGLGMFAGGITGLIVCLANGTMPHHMPALDGTAIAVLAVAVLIGTFGAYGLFLRGVSLVGPVYGNMLGAVEPVSATAISALWLATPFVWADWAGLSLMVATIVLVALQAGEKA